MKKNCVVSARTLVFALALTAALVLNTTAIAQAPPGSLWYNGDLNYVNALDNERNTAISQAAVYDDFDVTSPLGWQVTAVFSDNIITADTTAVAGADWEIRIGVSEGNAGTLIASGATSSPLVIHTGRYFLDTPEFIVEVTGLNVFLPMLPSGQHYWLNVTPVGYGHGRSLNTTTSGFNCVGTPCGNDDNAFWNSTYFGTFFDHTYNHGYGQNDYSMGVIGTVVPEPTTIGLLTCGVAALLIAVCCRRSTKQRILEKTKMKIKMNLARNLLTLSALVIFVSNTPQSRGQTLGDEINMGPGFEPVVSCDRRVSSSDTDKRIQFVWTYSGQIYRAISHQLGATLSWIVGVPSDDPSFNSDPFAVSDIWSTDPAVPRFMYFGWLGTDASNIDYFARSQSGTNVDSGPEVAQGNAGDNRPWLAVDKASLYLSFAGGDGYVKQATIPTGTPSPPPVDWSHDPVPVLSPSPSPGTALVPNLHIAAHSDSVGNEIAFVMGLQYVTPQPPCTGANLVRIQRSTDRGVHWGNEEAVKIGGFDGFVYGRDDRMLNFHITRDPNTSSNYVYAFYVRNEANPYPTGPPKRNVLYCTASPDGGNSWNGERVVFAPSPSDLAPNFAPVPHNCDNNTDGFYRIGRVWSCVDDNGNVYVAWMDNRYGQYNATKDYWHVFCARSTHHGDSWDPPFRVSGTGNPQASASIGGFNFADYVPPGDVLTCDVDSIYLYVAWPDSRNQQGDPTLSPQAYFRRVQF